MDIEKIRTRTLTAISPLKPAELDKETYHQLFLSAKRTNAGRDLPPYFLVYFLLIDLLGFRNTGPEEKTAWSVPVEFEGTPFLIEHRKFGLGIFGLEGAEAEAIATLVANRLKSATRAARPYFEWRAEQAASQSHLNVVNRSRDLLEHLQFHLDQYDARVMEADARKDEAVRSEIGTLAWVVHYPSGDLRREARHFAIAAIEGFFSWTEHVFIHIAILCGVISTGKQVGDLAKADWANKYKTALNVEDPIDKRFYDELTDLRRQLRNFVAHGSFGKDGEAFQFHSGAGAVPMLLPYKATGTAYRFGSGLDFQLEPAIGVIKAFMDHLWAGPRSPAKVYIQDYELPAVLTYVADGTYEEAMGSDADMKEFTAFLAQRIDDAANMDF